MSGFAEGARLFGIIFLLCLPVVVLIAGFTYAEKMWLNRSFELFAKARGWKFTKDLSWIGVVHPSTEGLLGKDHTAVVLLASGGTYAALAGSGIAGVYTTVFTTLTIRGPRVGELVEETLQERSGVRQIALRSEGGVVHIVFSFAMSGKRHRAKVERVLVTLEELLG